MVGSIDFDSTESTICLNFNEEFLWIFVFLHILSIDEVESFNNVVFTAPGLNDITCRKMMGEYLIYYKGKLTGGIYDNRFLVKPVKSAVELMPDTSYEIPYEGAKKMLLVCNVEDKEFLSELMNAVYMELPEKK